MFNTVESTVSHLKPSIPCHERGVDSIGMRGQAFLRVSDILYGSRCLTVLPLIFSVRTIWVNLVQEAG
jgi:hypothetical protein